VGWHVSEKIWGPYKVLIPGAVSNGNAEPEKEAGRDEHLEVDRNRLQNDTHNPVLC